MSFRGSDSDRGNLLLGSEALYHPINIEHFGYSMLIGAVIKATAVVEIATGINALAMTVGVISGST